MLLHVPTSLWSLSSEHQQSLQQLGANIDMQSNAKHGKAVKPSPKLQTLNWSSTPAPMIATFPLMS